MRKSVKSPAKKVNIQVRGSLNIAIFKEGKMYIAFAPALDLAAQGRSVADARKQFEEVFDIYLEETLRRGTLEKDLVRCGWRRRANNIRPPLMTKFSPYKLGSGIELTALAVVPLSERRLVCPA